jgi:hypothetical protein
MLQHKNYDPERYFGFGTDNFTGHFISERSLSYLIPERDAVKSPSATLKVGTEVTFFRCIQRVGYERDMYSFSVKQLDSVALEILSNNTGLTIDVIEKVTSALNLRHPYKSLRKAVAYKLFGKSGKTSKRSMWFWNPKNITHQGVISSKVVRWTGTYHPFDMFDGEYEPPFLQGVRQHLYVVQDLCCNRSRLVHPDDIL